MTQVGSGVGFVLLVTHLAHGPLRFVVLYQPDLGIASALAAACGVLAGASPGNARSILLQIANGPRAEFELIGGRARTPAESVGSPRHPAVDRQRQDSGDELRDHQVLHAKEEAVGGVVQVPRTGSHAVGRD